MPKYNNRTYAIVNAATWETVKQTAPFAAERLHSKIMTKEADKLRYNRNRTSFVIKTDEPDNVQWLIGFSEGNGLQYTTYTHEQILTEMAKEEWQPVEDTVEAKLFNPLPVR